MHAIHLMMTLKTQHFMVKILKDRHLEESDKDVEVFPAQLSNINDDELTTHICNFIDPLQESSRFGILSLQIVVEKLGQYNL